MTILQDSSDAQTISFIPKEFDAAETYTVQIKNELTNTVAFEDTAASFTESSYYKEYNNTFTGLTEDEMYVLTITNDANSIIFKDKLFCTNQTLVSYSVNNNEYTEHSEDNEFIVL